MQTQVENLKIKQLQLLQTAAYVALICRVHQLIKTLLRGKNQKVLVIVLGPVLGLVLVRVLGPVLGPVLVQVLGPALVQVLLRELVRVLGPD